MTRQVDLLIDRARILTLDDGRAGPLTGARQGELGLLEHGALAVDQGRILLLGDREDVLPEIEPLRVVDAHGAVVMPGFVDSHTHPLWSGSRISEFERRIAGATYVELMAAGGGIASTVRATRAASDEELLRRLLDRLDEFATQGTTTIEAKTGYGLSVGEELRQLRLLNEADCRHAVSVVPTFLGAHAVPDEAAGDGDSYVATVIDEMLPAVATRSPEAFCDVFCDEGAFSLGQAGRILKRAKDLGLRLKVHSDEFAHLGCAQLAASLGAVSVDHLVVTPAREMDALALSGTVAVLLPGTTFGLGSAHYADAREWIARGVPVAVASDYNPGTCPCTSLPFMMALATRYMRMSPAEAVVAVTRNAAAAVGRDDTTGRLAAGRQADLVLLDGDDYRELAYRFGSSSVRGVMIAGAWVLDPGSINASATTPSQGPSRRPPAGR